MRRHSLFLSLPLYQKAGAIETANGLTQESLKVRGARGHLLLLEQLQAGVQSLTATRTGVRIVADLELS